MSGVDSSLPAPTEAIGSEVIDASEESLLGSSTLLIMRCAR
jgi:hypothetical protein